MNEIRWMVGMVDADTGSVCVRVSAEGQPLAWAVDGDRIIEHEDEDDATPDWSHPGTLGCLRAQVRELYEDPTLTAKFVPMRGDVRPHWRIDEPGPWGRSLTAPTEHGVWLVAHASAATAELGC